MLDNANVKERTIEFLYVDREEGRSYKATDFRVKRTYIINDPITNKRKRIKKCDVTKGFFEITAWNVRETVPDTSLLLTVFSVYQPKTHTFSLRRLLFIRTSITSYEVRLVL